MVKKYIITYRAVIRHRDVIVYAFSKSDARRRFNETYPKYKIIAVEEIKCNM